MKSLIRKLLTEEKQKKSFYSRFNKGGLKKAVDKQIDAYMGEIGRLHNFYGSDIISEVAQKWALDYTTSSYLIFKYLMERDEDPTTIYNMSDWLYKSNDVLDFLKSSGYYEKYVELHSFHDLIIEDGKVILDVEWIDFANWFDEPEVVEKALGEDWAEFFDIWRKDTEFLEICELLDDEAVKYVLERLIEDYDGKDIYGLNHREEFTYLHGDNDFFNMSEKADEVRQITDRYNLNVFIDESDLSQSEVVDDMYNEYSNAYNLVAEDEIFKECKSEIESYLGVSVIEGEVKFDVTGRINELIDEYIEGSSENPTDEHSSFTDMVETLLRSYSGGNKLSTSDISYFYPDEKKLKEYFSELIVQR
tara:strand:+ start:576 stop:1661 length:1086 start_codon:yes stop_codon:yes gene_type:complete